MDGLPLKRKTIKPMASPNPLFEQWLEEWRVEAANKNLDLQYCYKNALFSLRKYPLKLNSGSECLILKNFGRQLCAKLDKKLAEFKKDSPDLALAVTKTTETITSSPHQRIKASKRNKRKPESPLPSSATRSGTSSPKKKKSYVPSVRSGGYAILIALLQRKQTAPDKEFMRKNELIDKAQEFCDVSFTKSENVNYYTAWSSMSSLIKKGLVTKTGNPAKYSLTKEGGDLAATLSSDENSSSLSCLFKQKYQSSIPENDNFSKFTWPSSSGTNFIKTSPLKSPCSSDLISSSFSSQLLSNDTWGSPSKIVCKKPTEKLDLIDLTFDEDFNNLVDDPLPVTNFKTYCLPVSSEINKPVLGTSSEINSFEQIIFVPNEFEIILLVDIRETSGKNKNPMSDDTIRWLTNLETKFETRCLNVGDFIWIARDQSGKELLLPYIAERKRMDDLGSSIKDGRFHEQKFRLRQCGLQNVIYLIEKYGKDIGLGLPLNTLHQAIVNTQLVDRFYVKMTNSHSHSMTYLSVFTRFLTEFFKDKTLISCLKNDLPTFDVNEDIVSLITYTEFSKSSIKNKKLKIHEMFLKQLIQLKGLSVEKAFAITQKYPTPRHLIAAFKKSENPEMLLSNLSYGLTNRNVGPTISKTIHKLYSCERLE